MAELRRRRDAVADADLVELRLDSGQRPGRGRRARRAGGCRSIVTCRPAWEGGSFAGSEEERRAHARARRWRSAPSTWTSNGARDFDDLVASHGGPPHRPVDARLRRRAGRSRRARARRCARPARRSSRWRSRPTRLSDCVPLLDLGAQVGRGRAAPVLIGMGTCGLATRVLPRRFGSRWTYAGLRARRRSDTPRGRCSTQYRFRRIDARRPTCTASSGCRCRTRCRRRCTTPRSRRRASTPSTCRCPPPTPTTS